MSCNQVAIIKLSLARTSVATCTSSCARTCRKKPLKQDKTSTVQETCLRNRKKPTKKKWICYTSGWNLGLMSCAATAAWVSFFAAFFGPAGMAPDFCDSRLPSLGSSNPSVRTRSKLRVGIHFRFRKWYTQNIKKKTWLSSLEMMPTWVFNEIFHEEIPAEFWKIARLSRG